MAVAVAVVLVVWGAVAAWMLVDARRHLDRGVRAVEQARGRLSPGDLVAGEGLGPLRDAEAAFRTARARVRSPVVSPLRALPVVGRQLRSVDALAAAAATVVDTGLGAVADARGALEEERRDPAARVRLLRRLAATARDARARVSDLDLGPDDALVTPLAEARADFRAELAELRDSLDAAATVAGGLAEVLDGPRHYLLLGANNAEMRAGSGMFLTLGTLDLEAGGLGLGELRPAQESVLPAGAVTLEGALAEHWGWAQPTRDFRNVAVTPRFDATAPLAARMWRELTGETVDGVLAVDVPLLAAVLEATGPVDLGGGGTVGAGEVEDLLLRDQYEGIEHGTDQSGRRERLAEIAAATLGALADGDWDAATLADGLAGAARGRHLLAWSPRPGDAAVWEAAGVDGAVPPDAVGVALLNRGGNKLDPYLDVTVEVDARPTGGAGRGGVALSVEVVIVNEAPAGLASYAGGPFPGLDAAPGEYVGILAVTVPGAATHGEVVEAGPVVAFGDDGPVRTMAAEFRVPRGERRRLAVRFGVPDRMGSLAVVPSARVPPVTWHHPGGSFTDDAPERVTW